MGASGYEETATGTLLGESVERHASGASLHLFKGSEVVDPWGEARLGFDAVLRPGITLGTGIGYATVAQDAPNNASSDISLFIIVPRLGFMLGPSRYLGVWLRAGLGYTSVTVSAAGTTDVTQRALDLVVDPQLVVTPFPHVGIMVGPALNIGVSGSVSQDSNRADFTSSSYGVSAGLALLF